MGLRGYSTRTLFVALLVLAVSGVSCNLSKQERQDMYAAQLDPLIGKATRDELAQMYGIPMKKDTVGDSEYWLWRFKARKDADDAFIPQKNTFFKHEDLTVGFDVKGVMLNWRVAIPK